MREEAKLCQPANSLYKSTIALWRIYQKKMGPQRRHCLVFIKQHSCNSMKHRKKHEGNLVSFWEPQSDRNSVGFCATGDWLLLK